MRVTRLSAHNVVSGSLLGVSARINVTLNTVESGDAIGAAVGTASVVDSADASQAYVLTDDAGGRFDINESTGAITLQTEAEAGLYFITIQATGTPSGAIVTHVVPILVVGETAASFLPLMRFLDLV